MIDFGPLNGYYDRMTTINQPTKYPSFKQEVCVMAGNIQWRDCPERWGGPWVSLEGIPHVVYRVKDYRFMSINSDDLLIAHHREYNKYCAYNMPNKVVRQLPDFAENGYRIVMYDDDECSSSTLTEEDLNTCLSLMTKEQISAWEKKVNDLTQKFADYDLKARPSITRPFVVSLYGNDDTSYGIAVPTLDDAKNIINELTENPTWSNLYRLGFVFTN